MISDVRMLFCKWSRWELEIFSALSQSLAEPHKAILQAQLDAVTKIQRILGWTEIDLYVMSRGRVCWDDVPCFDDMSEFRLARARTDCDGIVVQSDLTCVGGHLFCIESDVAIKNIAFRPDLKIQIYEIDSRYAL